MKMQVWKIAGGTMALLGGLALVVASAAPIRAQQRTFVVTSDSNDGQDRKVIIRRSGSVDGNEIVSMAGGVRLGVGIKDLTADDAAKLRLPAPSGVLIDSVDKASPAEKAGVLQGDVAVTYDGDAVRSAAQFTRLVRESVAGRAVKLAVVRGGKRVELTVTPEARDTEVRAWIDEPTMRGERDKESADGKDIEKEVEREFRIVPRGEGPSWRLGPMGPLGPMGRFQWHSDDPADMLSMAQGQGRGRLGVTVQNLSPELAEFFGVKEGALAVTVAKDSPAAKAGIKAGDVITAIDGKAVADPEELIAALRDKAGEVSVTVMRDKKALTLKATIDKPEIQKKRTVIQGVPS
jgi:serine protease Do